MSNKETTFSFIVSKYLYPKMNIGYTLTNINEDYDSEGNWELVLCSNMPEPYDCIDEDGCLIEEADGLVCFKISDIYTNENEDLEKPYFDLLVTPIDDYQSGFTIELQSGKSTIQIRTGDEIEQLEGMFLCRRSNGFVLAFAKAQDIVGVDKYITIPFDSKLCGVGHCPYGG